MLLSRLIEFGIQTLTTKQATQLIRQRNRFAQRYSEQAALINLISQRLLERLQLVKITPEVIVDLGSFDGSTCRSLKDIYNKAQIIGVEPATRLCQIATKQVGWFSKQHYISALPEHLPLANNSVDLVILNLYPVWLTDPNPLFAEINRILTAEGLILFSSLGPDTLKQINDSWRQADEAYPHTMLFTDMHDIGDALTRNGFHNIVMENEPLNINYPDIDSIHDDLRLTGHALLTPERRKTLTGKQRYQRYIDALTAQMTPELNITYDLIFGHGWKGYKQPKHAINALDDTHGAIPFKAID